MYAVLTLIATLIAYLLVGAERNATDDSARSAAALGCEDPVAGSVADLDVGAAVVRVTALVRARAASKRRSGDAEQGENGELHFEFGWVERKEGL